MFNVSEYLKSFQEVIGELATEYDLQYEIVEAIIIKFITILYYGATHREVKSE